MDFKSALLVAGGGGFYFIGHSITRIGDAAPFIEGGVSQERLYYHLIALGIMVGAMVMFIAAGVRVFKATKK